VWAAMLPARDPVPDPTLYPAGAVTQPATGPTLADTLVFNIPHLADIAVDGKSGDWGERGFAVDVLANTLEHPRPRADFDASFRLGWNEHGLLVLVNVTDV